MYRDEMSFSGNDDSGAIFGFWNRKTFFLFYGGVILGFWKDFFLTAA